MLTLYGFAPAFGLPDLSPFVIKVATWCRLAGVAYEYKPGDVRKAPKKKLPYIDDGGTLVADSSAIIAHLTKKHRDLDEGMTPRERALARAVQSMLEEHLYFTSLYLRWCDERGWAVLGPHFRNYLHKFGGAPSFLTGVISSSIRGGVKKSTYAQGVGRHSPAEVEATAISLLDALSELLGENTWFFGDTPRTLDATVFAFVYPVRDAPFDNAVRAYVKTKANLVAYIDRVLAAHWKELPLPL